MSLTRKVLIASAFFLALSLVFVHYKQSQSAKSSVYYKNYLDNHPYLSIMSSIMSIFGRGTSSNPKDEEWKNAKTVYEFTVKDLDNEDVKLDKYKGKVLLIVNVASKCGFTKSNYKDLNELYNLYHEQGLEILGFPCNQFGHQEPGCEVDIREFLKKNDVKWDVFGKVDVNGENAIPLFKWLQNQVKGTITDMIKWNFTKFLINKQGVPIGRFAPNTRPMTFKDAIEGELKMEAES